VGLIEVPMGTPLRQIIFEIGGGYPKGTGSRRCRQADLRWLHPEQFLDLPVDYESLKEVGSIMGSGG